VVNELFTHPHLSPTAPSHWPGTLLLQAREIILLVTGSSKAIALYHAVEEGVSHMWTCSALWVLRLVSAFVVSVFLSEK
jgi:glucosamine-6-phosphate deaminase